MVLFQELQRLEHPASEAEERRKAFPGHLRKSTARRAPTVGFAVLAGPGALVSQTCPKGQTQSLGLKLCYYSAGFGSNIIS